MHHAALFDLLALVICVVVDQTLHPAPQGHCELTSPPYTFSSESGGGSIFLDSSMTITSGEMFGKLTVSQ